MSSCVGKIMENMLNERLIWISKKDKWFDKDQNGFRRGKTCINNLVNLIAEAELSMKTDSNTIAAFLDVSSAYDNVRIDILYNR